MVLSDVTILVQGLPITTIRDLTIGIVSIFWRRVELLIVLMAKEE